MTLLFNTGNPVGLAIVQLATPFIVAATEDIVTMTWVYTIPAAVGFVLALVAFWKNKPPTPPSSGTESDPEPFLKGLKQVHVCVSKCTHIITVYCILGFGQFLFLDIALGLGSGCWTV